MDVAEGLLTRGAGRESDLQVAEPLEGLAPAAAETVSTDPMLHWRDEPARADQEESTLMASERAWFAAETDVTDEYRENRDVAMGLPVRKGERDRMSQSNTSALDQGSGRRMTTRGLKAVNISVPPH